MKYAFENFSGKYALFSVTDIIGESSLILKNKDGNSAEISSNHDKECREAHYLSFEDFDTSDFDGMEFDLNDQNFFEEVDGYGIRLLPINGHPVSVPGYGFNNGYYSNQLELIVKIDGEKVMDIDVTDCQVQKGY